MKKYIPEIIMVIVAAILALVFGKKLKLGNLVKQKPTKEELIKPIQAEIEDNNTQAAEIVADTEAIDKDVAVTSASVEEIKENQQARDEKAKNLFPDMD